MQSSSTKMSLWSGEAPISARSRSVLPLPSVSSAVVSHVSGRPSPSRSGVGSQSGKIAPAGAFGTGAPLVPSSFMTQRSLPGTPSKRAKATRSPSAESAGVWSPAASVVSRVRPAASGSMIQMSLLPQSSPAGQPMYTMRWPSCAHFICVPCWVLWARSLVAPAPVMGALQISRAWVA
jgi:hypothetical protein